MNVGTRVALAFFLGAGIGGATGYIVAKRALEKNCQQQIDEMHAQYEAFYAKYKEKYKEVAADAEPEQEVTEDVINRVPVDIIDRVTAPHSDYVDYASITAEYYGTTESAEENEQDEEEQKKSKSVQRREEIQSESDPEKKPESKTKRKKKSNRLPVRAINDEEFFDLTMNSDDYTLRQFYLDIDRDCWVKVNGDSPKDDIAVKDFAIPYGDMNFDRSGIAYFVNDEAMQLYKFYRDGAY